MCEACAVATISMPPTTMWYSLAFLLNCNKAMASCRLATGRGEGISSHKSQAFWQKVPCSAHI